LAYFVKYKSEGLKNTQWKNFCHKSPFGGFFLCLI
jgi:hypothetical protein